MCVTQLAGDLLLKMLKYFEVIFKMFEFSYTKQIVESSLVYSSWLFFYEWPNFVSWPRQ